MNFAKASMTEASLGGGLDAPLPSGYTYFGQFVDHDITLDTTPLSDAELDPNRLHNFRTPRLDLDCLYGLGPDAQPYLYEQQPFTGRFLVGQTVRLDPGIDGFPPIDAQPEFPDLPRLKEPNQHTALIGDPRNDENVIVAQIHLAFLLAHNRLVDLATTKLKKARPELKAHHVGQLAFEKARHSLRRLYQWIVWKDYVARICRESVHRHALHHDTDASDERIVWKMGYKDIYDWKNTPFMPLEFSVAAYRFGHTLVRTGYQMNDSVGFRRFLATFSESGNNLRGGRPLDLSRVVQWDWFLDMQSTGPFPQVTRRFDTKLATALSQMPDDPENPGKSDFILNVLAARNLVRGVRMKMPSGIAVAKAMAVKPITLAEDEPETLWFYILKEADDAGESGGKGERLGSVGSIIVAATFEGLLKGDPLSFFNIEPTWTPDDDELLRLAKEQVPNLVADAEGKWTLASVIRLSGLPVNADPFPNNTVPVPPPAAPAPPAAGG
jgi:hypothetical protein